MAVLVVLLAIRAVSTICHHDVLGTGNLLDPKTAGPIIAGLLERENNFLLF
jgi:hypothetical protein